MDLLSHERNKDSMTHTVIMFYVIIVIQFLSLLFDMLTISIMSLVDMTLIVADIIVVVFYSCYSCYFCCHCYCCHPCESTNRRSINDCCVKLVISVLLLCGCMSSCACMCVTVVVCLLAAAGSWRYWGCWGDDGGHFTGGR